jgi:hypothetical protein
MLAPLRRMRGQAKGDHHLAWFARKAPAHARFRRIPRWCRDQSKLAAFQSALESDEETFQLELAFQEELAFQLEDATQAPRTFQLEEAFQLDEAVKVPTFQLEEAEKPALFQLELAFHEELAFQLELAFQEELAFQLELAFQEELAFHEELAFQDELALQLSVALCWSDAAFFRLAESPFFVQSPAAFQDAKLAAR